MEFPSLADVAARLREINASVDAECDVRLQVYNDGQWAIRWGLSDYDQDHRGYWGASSVPGSQNPEGFSTVDSCMVAEDLVNQAESSFWEYGPEIS